MQRETTPEESKEEEVQAKAESEGKSSDSGNLESQLNGSKGGGSPLADEVRAFMEPRFGADFSGVRVHTDSNAVQMNKELGAQAFAHGSDIYYGAGKSPGKDELTAHELTHTVQQTGIVERQQNESQLRQQNTDEATVSLKPLVSQNVTTPHIQRWAAPTDWLDYIGLGVDLVERAYIELAYEEGEEKDFRRFENTLFFAIDLVLAALPGVGGGGLAVRGSRQLAVAGWGMIPDSAKLELAEQVAKQMGWSATKALQMINLYMEGGRSGGGGGRKGGKKEDIKQIESVAKEFKMTPEQRREFGDFVEEQKASGYRGTKNERGDFTYEELRKLAREFLDQ